MSKFGGEHVSDLAKQFYMTVPDEPILRGDIVPLAQGITASLRRDVKPPEALTLDGHFQYWHGAALLHHIGRMITGRQAQFVAISSRINPGPFKADTVIDRMRPQKRVVTGQLSEFAMELLAPEELPPKVREDILRPRQYSKYAEDISEPATLLPFLITARLRGIGPVACLLELHAQRTVSATQNVLYITQSYHKWQKTDNKARHQAKIASDLAMLRMFYNRASDTYGGFGSNS